MKTSAKANNGHVQGERGDTTPVIDSGEASTTGTFNFVCISLALVHILGMIFLFESLLLTSGHGKENNEKNNEIQREEHFIEKETDIQIAFTKDCDRKEVS